MPRRSLSSHHRHGRAKTPENDWILPTQADEKNMDLQVFFNKTLSIALGLLQNRLLHEHEALVAETVSTLERLIRHSVWLETGHASFDQAWEILKLSQGALSNVCQQLQLLPSGRRNRME